jgi:hypothetical protein
MGKTSYLLLAGVLIAWAVAGGGSGRADAPGPGRRTDPDLPAPFTSRPARRLDNPPPANPVTDAGATLGLVLFYDTRLSANDTISCGSCHPPQPAPLPRGTLERVLWPGFERIAAVVLGWAHVRVAWCHLKESRLFVRPAGACGGKGRKTAADRPARPGFPGGATALG